MKEWEEEMKKERLVQSSGGLQCGLDTSNTMNKKAVGCLKPRFFGDETLLVRGRVLMALQTVFLIWLERGILKTHNHR